MIVVDSYMSFRFRDNVTPLNENSLNHVLDTASNAHSVAVGTRDIISDLKIRLEAHNIFDLRDPTTGQISFMQDILNNIFNLMTAALTASEYDSLNLSAAAYDTKNLTALDFDMRGRLLLNL